MIDVSQILAAKAARKLAERFKPGTIVRSLDQCHIHKARVSAVGIVGGEPIAVVAGEAIHCGRLSTIRDSI